MPTLKAISLFSGAGGLDLGLETAGFEVVAAVESDSVACATLRANKLLGTLPPLEFERWFSKNVFPGLAKTPLVYQQECRRVMAGVRRSSMLSSANIIEQDIRQVSVDALLKSAGCKPKDIALVAGGPPCQTFSRAGKRESVDDARGRLFMEFVRVVAGVRPRWFLFENVKGLAQTRSDVWWLTCARCNHRATPSFSHPRLPPKSGSSAGDCPACGSALRWDTRLGRKGGALDIILGEFNRIGYKSTTVIVNAVDYGVPQYRERLFIVGTRDGEGFSVPPTLATEGASLWSTLFSSENPAHPWPLDPQTAVLWVKNVVRPHDEPVTWDLRRPCPTVGAHQSAKLAIAHNGVPLEQLRRQQWHSRGNRQGQTDPVHVEHSYLSDADLLALQTFPSWWFLAGTRMQRAFQIGNAVPPTLAAAIAAGIIEGSNTPWVQSHVQRHSPRSGQRKRRNGQSVLF